MKFLIVLIISFLYPQTFAGHSESPTTGYRVLKEIKINDKQKAYVVAREDGHLLGQPFQVELRLRCESGTKDIMDLPIHDSFSVCDLSPKSLKVNRQNTVVAMKVKSADVKSYYDAIDRGVASPQVKCAKPTEIKKFSLRKLCQ